MTISHGTATRNAVCDLVVDRVDVGTGTSYLYFLTAGNVEVAKCAFQATAFGAASNGSATANPISNDTDADGGVTTKFEIRDKNGLMIIAGSVGTSGADINLSSTTIGAGDIVSISSMTYTAMP